MDWCFWLKVKIFEPILSTGFKYWTIECKFVDEKHEGLEITFDWLGFYDWNKRVHIQKVALDKFSITRAILS
jgi:hypothetical protein